MRTWSIESVFVRAYTAVVDKLAVVERLTRPPRLGDMDAVDGAEQLAELEAEEEVHEPPLAAWELELLLASRSTCELLHDGATAIGWWLHGKPVPGHPQRTRDYWRLAEIELRKRAKELDDDDDTEADDGGFECIACGALYNKLGDHDCAFGDQTSSADPFQVGVCRDARTADDSGEESSGHSPRPSSSPRPPANFTAWSDLAERMVNHLPSATADAGEDLVAQFDTFIEKWVLRCHHGHLLDDDANDGERIRQAIRDIADETPCPVTIADLRYASDLLLELPHPSDPRDYDYRALGERLSAAADYLTEQTK